MRIRLLLCLLLVLLPGVVQAQTDTCAVPDNYIEALDENTSSLLRVNVLLNTGGGSLTDIDAASVHYRQLISMRHYHEDQRAELPDCAQPLNNAAIAAVTAAQDVFGLLFLQGVDVDGAGSYDDEITRAAAHLREQFGNLNTVTVNTTLVPLPD
jgi:hypothetical protein